MALDSLNCCSFSLGLSWKPLDVGLRQLPLFACHHLLSFPTRLFASVLARICFHFHWISEKPAEATPTRCAPGIRCRLPTSRSNMWRGRRGPATGHGFVWTGREVPSIVFQQPKRELQTKPSTSCAYTTGQSPGACELVSVRRTHSGELNKRGQTPQRRSLNGWREINWLASGLGFSVNRQDRVPCEST